ncbi:MAG: hypothetical protein QM790_03875 [Nibricoccus sp.]
MPDSPSKKTSFDPSWFALGIGVGVAVGVATQNLALWLALGVACGLLSSTLFPKREKKD